MNEVGGEYNFRSAIRYIYGTIRLFSSIFPCHSRYSKQSPNMLQEIAAFGM